MVSGGTLTIECKQEQDKIKLIIEDTGAGIAESDLERIFDPFFYNQRGWARYWLRLV